MKLKLKGVFISRDGKEWLLTRVDYLSSDVNLDTGKPYSEEGLMGNQLQDYTKLGLKQFHTKMMRLEDSVKSKNSENLVMGVILRD